MESAFGVGNRHWKGKMCVHIIAVYFQKQERKGG